MLMVEHEAIEPRFAVTADAVNRWRTDARDWLRSEHHRFIVAEEGGCVVGFIHAFPWQPPPIHPETLDVYVQEVYVVPLHRGQGIGKALVAEVQAWAKEVGAGLLRLVVLAANEQGKRFWERLGMMPFSVTMMGEVKN